MVLRRKAADALEKSAVMLFLWDGILVERAGAASTVARRQPHDEEIVVAVVLGDTVNSRSLWAKYSRGRRSVCKFFRVPSTASWNSTEEWGKGEGG